ncbi:MAG: hypothetical protein Q9191_006673 [Dirinaria sp. TL-2023a]
MEPATQPQSSSARVLDSQFWSDLGMKYEEAYSQDPGLVAIVQQWLNHLPPHSTILECGCGTGKPIARTIADHSSGPHHYHGIDIAAGMVSLCQKQVPGGTYQVVNMLDFVPPPPAASSSPDNDNNNNNTQSYNGIVASFSHFELSPQDHVQMARNWSQWLRPGGYLLLCTITADGGDEVAGIYHMKNADTRFDPETGCATGIENIFLGNRILVTVYTREGWKKLLRDAGFEVLVEKAQSFCPRAEEAPEEPRFYIIARKG